MKCGESSPNGHRKSDRTVHRRPRALARLDEEFARRRAFHPGREIALRRGGDQTMITILVILLILALLGGGFGYGRFGALGMSPAAIIVIILIVLALSGRI